MKCFDDRFNVLLDDLLKRTTQMRDGRDTAASEPQLGTAKVASAHLIQAQFFCRLQSEPL